MTIGVAEGRIGKEELIDLVRENFYTSFVNEAPPISDSMSGSYGRGNRPTEQGVRQLFSRTVWADYSGDSLAKSAAVDHAIPPAPYFSCLTHRARFRVGTTPFATGLLEGSQFVRGRVRKSQNYWVALPSGEPLDTLTAMVSRSNPSVRP